MQNFASVFKLIFFIGVAGGAGALCRYGVMALTQAVFGPALRFPLATMTVNLVGSFLFALIWLAGSEGRGGPMMDEQTRKVILVGFLGAFTTFSTFAFETTHLFNQGQTWVAAGNFLIQNVLGIVCILLGFVAARALAS